MKYTYWAVLLGINLLLAGCLLDSKQDGDLVDANAYPHGVKAQPLLREIWIFGADNIYPRELAQRFDEAALRRLEKQLRRNRTVALADVFNPFLDSLGVSHTRLFDRRHQGYYMLRSLFSTRNLDTPKLFTVGVQLNDRDPGRISAVLDGTPAFAAGLKRGYRIVAVDGRPFTSLLQWQREDQVELRVETPSGLRTFTVDTVKQGFQRALANATRASDKVLDCSNGRRVGYFHLWSGTNDVFLQALKASVKRANEMQLDGYVLDLRDGFGGAWWRYLDPFFADRSEYFSYVTLDAKGVSDQYPAPSQDNPHAWAGPLAVIINGGTRSGKESLAFQFKQSGRATLFGSTTSGAFTAGLGTFAERDVNYLLYLAVAERRLNGEVIEGVGVAPDVPVEQSVGEDAELAAALSHLSC